VEPGGSAKVWRAAADIFNQTLADLYSYAEVFLAPSPNPDFARLSVTAGDSFYEISQVKATGREENLKKAIRAYNNALKTYTFDAFPAQYAATQNNLGNAYRTLGEVRDKEQNVQAAIAAYKEALRVRTFDAFPADYAATQNNLGVAYSTLGEVRDKEQNVQAAIAAYKEALRVRTFDAFPLLHGRTNVNLALTLIFSASSHEKPKVEVRDCLMQAAAALEQGIKAFESQHFEEGLNNALGLLETLRKEIGQTGQDSP
jgi:tetratricopeptide (TPR) repeat protein